MNTFCTYYNQGVCKSCDLITTDYTDQLSFKENLLRESLQHLKSPVFQKTIESPTLHFRNKAKFVVTGTIENPIIGLWGEKNLDQGRELLNCDIHLDEINQLLSLLKDFIQLAKLDPYHISTRKGELKGLIIFHSQESGETYLRFILRSKEAVDRIRKNLNDLIKNFPRLQCISINIQPIPHAVLEGEEEIYITDKTSILHQSGQISFSLGPKAFVQTNQKMAEKLYSTAANWVKDSTDKRFMELFCGQGAFSFFSAPYIEEGLGIEINSDAVKEANQTAKKYNFPHLKFKSADAGRVDEEMMKFNPGILLVNPPRRGLGEAINLILKHRPETVIYSSCNYETLAKDLEILSSAYNIRRVQLFDMFPHTKHFETLVELKL